MYLMNGYYYFIVSTEGDRGFFLVESAFCFYIVFVSSDEIDLNCIIIYIIDDILIDYHWTDHLMFALWTTIQTNLHFKMVFIQANW